MTEFIDDYPTTRQPVKAGQREANPYKLWAKAGFGLGDKTLEEVFSTSGRRKFSTGFGTFLLE